METTRDALEISQGEIIGAMRSEFNSFKNEASINQALQIAARSSQSRRRSPFDRRIIQGRPTLPCSKITGNSNLRYHCPQEFAYNVDWDSNEYRFAIGTLYVEHIEDIDVSASSPIQMIGSILSVARKESVSHLSRLAGFPH